MAFTYKPSKLEPDEHHFLFKGIDLDPMEERRMSELCDQEGGQDRTGTELYHQYVVVVYHVTIVAIGHGLLKKFWPMVIGCVLRTAGSSNI